MWPFTRTLSERYSKLVKLIKSIDSYFQLTEDKEDSLRLHLPNYKGNQTMDFHIYLMESQLYISFMTEIEGEKISCVNNFQKDTDQQDMFNAAMAANLDKVHQVLDKKYNEESEIKETKAKKEKNPKETKELTEEQRYALYYYLYTYSSPIYYNGDDETPSIILRMYKKTLGLSDYDVEDIINTPLYRTSEHLDNLKSIDDAATINMFLYACVTIIDRAESGVAIASLLNIAQELGISEEKLKDIIRNIEPTPCEHFFDRNNSDIWDNLDEKDTEEQSLKTAQSETDGDVSSDEVNSLNYFFDFDESYKKHFLTIMALRPGSEFHYYKPQTYYPLWKYKGELLDSQNPGPIGCSAFVWIMQHYKEKEDFCYLLDFLGLDCMGKKYLDLFASTAYKDAEEMMTDIKHNIPTFKLGNDPQKVQPLIHQTWLDLIVINNFIDYCSNSMDNLKGRNQSAKQLRDCSSIEDLALLFLLEFKVEIGCHSEKTEENTSSHNSFEEPPIVNSWSLLDFARAHGKMKRVPSSSRINSETGEKEHSAAYCVFVHPTNKDEQGKPVITAIVAFSSGLGELSVDEIVQQKSDLMVVKYTSGDYALRHKKATTDKSEKYFDADNISTEVTEEDMAQAWTDEFGVEYSKDKKLLIHAPEDLEEYFVREGTEVICDDAFSNVEFEDFDYYEITEKGLSPYDFIKEVSKLRIVGFPNTVISVGERVFDYCVKLEIIYIPKGEREKFKRLLPDYADLLVETENSNINDSIHENSAEEIWKDEYGVQYDRGYQTLLKAPKDIVKYVVEEGTVIIGASAFSYCEDLISVSFPESVKGIGQNAFSGCKKLESIILPENIKSIEKASFENCNSLRSVIIRSKKDSNKHMQISRDAFVGCESIVYFEWPEADNTTLYTYLADSIRIKNIVGKNGDIEADKILREDEMTFKTMSMFYNSIGMNITKIRGNNKDYKSFKNIDTNWPHTAEEFYDSPQSKSFILSENWYRCSGLGVLLGWNKYRAIDVDHVGYYYEENIESVIADFLYHMGLPKDYPWVVKSGSGSGFHIIFKSDILEDLSSKAFTPNFRYACYGSSLSYFNRMELRWKDHLVLPPSIHYSGKRYEFWLGIPDSEPTTLQINNIDNMIFHFCGRNSINKYNYCGKIIYLVETCKYYTSEDHYGCFDHGKVLDSLAWQEKSNTPEANNSIGIRYVLGNDVNANKEKALRHFLLSDTDVSNYNIASLIACGYFEGSKIDVEDYLSKIKDDHTFSLVNYDTYDDSIPAKMYQQVRQNYSDLSDTQSMEIK